MAPGDQAVNYQNTSDIVVTRIFSSHVQRIICRGPLETGSARRHARRRTKTPWMWTLAFGHHEDRMPTHGYGPTREAAMAAFAKSWRRE